MTFEVTILGSSSATPIYQRHPTAQVLRINEHFFLVDCGEGTLIQMNRYRVKYHRINHIFISHLHGDHYLGLMGLISTLHLQGRTQPLHIYAPAELREIVDIQLRHSQTDLRYPLHFHDTNPGEPEVIYEDEDLVVRTIILSHRIPCTGFLFAEKPRQRKLDKEALRRHAIPVEAYADLKNGKDYTAAGGRVIANAELTHDPRQPRSYAFCSDTIYDERILPHIRGVDMLYHESTFLSDMEDRARETYHTTAAQAGRIAKLAEVRELLIGHFSARYRNLNELLEEAKTEFANTRLALEGDRFAIE
jgi:ribonuclease Z